MKTYRYLDAEHTLVQILDDESGETISGLASAIVPDGIVPEPFTESAEMVIARLERALDRHLDDVANSYRYESIRTMVTYASSEHPTFGPEGRAAVKFRDAVYAYGIQVIADVQAEIRAIPTEAELIAELPPITDFFE